jgi:hypothetical protein
LHRVVPGVPSIWSRPPTALREILPGHQGRTPPRLARCSRLRGRLTRATTDSHREARPARAASGASTLHQPLWSLRAGLPLGPSPHDAAPTPSLSQWRSELRRPDGGRAGLASFVGARIARNGRDQWLATTRLSMPQGFIASPLHRVVMPCLLSRRNCLQTWDCPDPPQIPLNRLPQRSPPFSRAQHGLKPRAARPQMIGQSRRVRWTPDFGRPDKVEPPGMEAPYQEYDDAGQATCVWGSI